jgi:hypothetical protein
MIGFHGHAVLYLAYRHGSRFCKEFGQNAVFGGGKVLHEHERHARMRRKILQQHRECFQPSCGGADPDNEERFLVRPVLFSRLRSSTRLDKGLEDDFTGPALLPPLPALGLSLRGTLFLTFLEGRLSGDCLLAMRSPAIAHHSLKCRIDIY